LRVEFEDPIYHLSREATQASKSFTMIWIDEGFLASLRLLLNTARDRLWLFCGSLANIEVI
jgi:hypothetical protein